MKTLFILLLLLPSYVFADKYDDVNSNLRDVLIAISQVSFQGKDASIVSQIQNALTKITKDITDLQKESKDQCKETKK